MHGSPSRKRACRTRLFYGGREKQYKSYYPLRRDRCEKALSPRLRGLGLAKARLALFPSSIPSKGKGWKRRSYPAMPFSWRPTLLASATTRTAVSFARARSKRARAVRVYGRLPFEFSHHSASPWLLEVATSNYPAKSSSSNYSRPPPLRYCYGFFVVTLLLRITRAVSWLTRYTRIYSSITRWYFYDEKQCAITLLHEPRWSWGVACLSHSRRFWFSIELLGSLNTSDTSHSPHAWVRKMKLSRLPVWREGKTPLLRPVRKDHSAKRI